MYTTIGNRAYINGNQGKYDNVVANQSVKYGRNAVDNYNQYLLEFAKQPPSLPKVSSFLELSDDEFFKTMAEYESQTLELTPIDYSMRYQPESVKKGNVDVMALLGAAYEEMGKNFSLGVKGLTEKLQKTLGSSNVSVQALDINKDKEIDMAEYATSILVSDMFSSDPFQVDFDNITGEVTNEGENASLALINEKNYVEASEIFSTVYKEFNLGAAQKFFKNNTNNLM